jgi:large subunit ribosomal protein L28
MFIIKQLRQHINTKVPGYTLKVMRGLYNGKKFRSSKTKSKSEQNTKIKVSPNVFKKVFHSEILDKSINVNVSSEALRRIRKFGSFDNYILLCPADKMVSMFG